MAIYAKIYNGSIVNIQEQDEVDAQDPAFVWIDISNLSPQPAIGWLYDGSSFSAPGLPAEAYGRSVSFSTDNVHDTYKLSDGSLFIVPAGTPQAAVYVKMAIQGNLLEFQAAVHDFVNSKYSLDVRFNFNAMYILAQQNNFANRMVYIEQLFTWAQAVVAYCAVYSGAVSALTDPVVIKATVWNFANIQIPDPLVSPLVAVGIMN